MSNKTKLTFTYLIDHLDSLPTDTKQVKLISNADSVIVFDDLKHYTDLSDLFNRLGNNIVIIVRQDATNGHWCLLRQQSPTNCIWYEPYGFTWDELFKRAIYTREIGNGVNHLLQLVKKSPRFTLNINRYQHQRFNTKDDKVRTCGLHISSRIAFGHLSNQDYNTLITSMFREAGLRPDDLVTLLNAIPLMRVL